MKQPREWLILARGNKTQQEIATASNINRSYYTQLESGDRDPSVTTAKKIAEVLDLNWTLFFEQQDNKAQQNPAFRTIKEA